MNEKTKQLGVMFSPNVTFGVGERDGKWVGSIDIGDYYYETDPYLKKEGAISELCGCLETLKLKTEQVIDELNGLYGNDNEYCEKHCKGYRDTGGKCFADGRCDAYWAYQKQKRNYEENHV